MPYIKHDERLQYDTEIKTIIAKWQLLDLKDVAGHFTYVVYRLLKYFSGKFWTRALGIGCLICAILEIYRKEHALYEDEKIKENGDV
jgi:hypothetical protein